MCRREQNSHSTSGVMNRAHLATQTRERGTYSRIVEFPKQTEEISKAEVLRLCLYDLLYINKTCSLLCADTSLSLLARLPARLCRRCDESNRKLHYCVFVILHSLI